MTAKLNKKRAVTLYEQARLHFQRGEWHLAAQLADQVATAGVLPEPPVVSVWADALAQLDRGAEAIVRLRQAAGRHPGALDLEARLGRLLLEANDVAGAVEHLERARPAFKRDPGFLTTWALALLRAGRLDEAERQLAAALLSGGGHDARLVLAMVKARHGDFAASVALATEVEARATDERLRWSARAVLAEGELLQGTPDRALAHWKAIRDAGKLEPDQWAHMAWAAQLAGEPALTDELVAARSAQGPTGDDRLLFAQIANVRGRPEVALEHLAAARPGPDASGPLFDFECHATRGRALRLLGRPAEARAELDLAEQSPAAAESRYLAPVWVDRGHLLAEAGEFEQADELFTRALAADPGDPEARRARELTARRVAWRDELEASTEARVDSARAEADSMRRRIEARESELDALKRELARLKAAEASRDDVDRQARAQAERERARAAEEARARLREELVAREVEVAEKARVVIDEALGASRATCPPALLQMLEVAERTYQQALYTELPAAAVAVLFSGALERGLFLVLVAPFDAWLDAAGLRAEFLAGGVRGSRGRRPEYADNFFEAFDRALPLRPPGLGELARVIDRRREPHLEPWRRFLEEAFRLSDADWKDLSAFVTWSKEHLRDPVAHGRAIELGYDELRRFREQVLMRFGTRSQGVLATLLAARRPLPGGEAP